MTYLKLNLTVLQGQKGNRGVTGPQGETGEQVTVIRALCLVCTLSSFMRADFHFTS